MEYQAPPSASSTTKAPARVGRRRQLSRPVSVGTVDPHAKFDGAIRVVGATDAAQIGTIIGACHEDRWHEHTFRQTIYPGATHQDTQTIFVKYKGHGRKIFDEPLFDALQPLLKRFKRTFRNFYGIERVPIRRVIFTRLPAKKGIPKHRDSGRFLEHHRRIHIPIVTHPDVMFLAGDAWQHLAAGTMYELNNQRTHAVRNPTEIDRIHMIVDIDTGRRS